MHKQSCGKVEHRIDEILLGVSSARHPQNVRILGIVGSVSRRRDLYLSRDRSHGDSCRLNGLLWHGRTTSDWDHFAYHRSGYHDINVANHFGIIDILDLLDLHGTVPRERLHDLGEDVG